MSRIIPLLAAVGLAVAHPAVAQTCKPAIPATTPTADFQFHGDGTVTHTPTELTWQRCLVGQSFDDNATPSDPTDDACTGSPTDMTWQAALQHADGETDWRLPNIKELASIVEQQCHDPAINAAVFPDTPSSYVWSASALVIDADHALVMFFGSGTGNGHFRGAGHRVRLVHGGQ